MNEAYIATIGAALGAVILKIVEHFLSSRDAKESRESTFTGNLLARVKELEAADRESEAQLLEAARVNERLQGAVERRDERIVYLETERENHIKRIQRLEDEIHRMRGLSGPRIEWREE